MCSTSTKIRTEIVQVQTIAERLKQHPDIRRILHFAKVQVIATDSGSELEINTATVDDSVVLYQTYGRIISRAAESSEISKIRLRHGNENLYYFSPEYRLSWV